MRYKDYLCFVSRSIDNSKRPKELVENGNGKAVFDFSLVTAFKVISKKEGSELISVTTQLKLTASADGKKYEENELDCLDI